MLKATLMGQTLRKNRCAIHKQIFVLTNILPFSNRVWEPDRPPILIIPAPNALGIALFHGNSSTQCSVFATFPFSHPKCDIPLRTCYHCHHAAQLSAPIHALRDSRDSKTFYRLHTRSSRACRLPNRSARLIPRSLPPHLSPRMSLLSQKATCMGRGRALKETRSTCVQCSNY